VTKLIFVRFRAASMEIIERIAVKQKISSDKVKTFTRIHRSKYGLQEYK
jgi:hypothetical protein